MSPAVLSSSSSFHGLVVWGWGLWTDRVFSLSPGLAQRTPNGNNNNNNNNNNDKDVSPAVNHSRPLYVEKSVKLSTNLVLFM